MRSVGRDARWSRAAQRTDRRVPGGPELADTEARGQARLVPLPRWELAL